MKSVVSLDLNIKPMVVRELVRLSRTVKMQSYIVFLAEMQRFVLFLTGMRLRVRLPRLTGMKKVQSCVTTW